MLLFVKGSLLLGIVDYLRRRFARLKLSAHLLNLRCLLIQACRDGLNFLLLLRGIRLEVFSLLGDKRLLSTIKRGNIDL
jgi:hypothetical protein